MMTYSRLATRVRDPSRCILNHRGRPPHIQHDQPQNVASFLTEGESALFKHAKSNVMSYSRSMARFRFLTLMFHALTSMPAKIVDPVAPGIADSGRIPYRTACLAIIF